MCLCDCNDVDAADEDMFSLPDRVSLSGLINIICILLLARVVFSSEIALVESEATVFSLFRFHGNENSETRV